MARISRAGSTDREVIEKLVAEYHASEGLIPRRERIAWAVDQQLQRQFPGILLVARDGNTPIGVALAVYTPSAELGRVMTVNNFFVRPGSRRKGVGREMVKHLIEECRLLRTDEINLEVFSGNKTAAAFWRSVGFEMADRALFKLKLRPRLGDQPSNSSSHELESAMTMKVSRLGHRISRLERSRRAVDNFTKACQADQRVIAAFLGGSLATGKADEQSDIDVYLVTRKRDYETFFADVDAFLQTWGGIAWRRSVRNFEGFGFDLIQFVMAEGIDGELALAHEENFRKTHGGPHIVLLDRIGLLKDLKFPILEFEDVVNKEEVEKSLTDFWMSTRNAIKAWTRARWWEAAESLGNMRKCVRSFARIVRADNYEERLAPTFTSLDPDAIAMGIRAAVGAYLIWAPEVEKKVGVIYPAELSRLGSRRVLDALEKLR